MSDLTCVHVRRSRFIDREIVFNIKRDEIMNYEVNVSLRKEMMDLGLALFRNRVEVHLKTARQNRNSKEINQVKDRIREFCDSRLQGYWTWKYQQRPIEDDETSVQIELMFEKEEELELFLKEHGTIIRLTY